MDNSTDYKYDVFISYSRKDTKTADKICEAFDKANISYFIDRKGIGGGMEFPSVLAQAIRESKVFLFLASLNSYESKFTQSEIIYAFNKKQKQDIIPYIIDKSKLPEDLEFTFSSINWRQLEEHPIDTVLINDVLEKIGRLDHKASVKPKSKFNFNGKMLARIALLVAITFFLFVAISSIASASYLSVYNSVFVNISAFSLLIMILATVIGLIHPKSLDLYNRKDVLKFYLVSAFILFITFGLSNDHNSSQTKDKIEQEAVPRQ